MRSVFIKLNENDFNSLGDTPEVLNAGTIGECYENLLCVGKNIIATHGQSESFIDYLFISNTGNVSVAVSDQRIALNGNTEKSLRSLADSLRLWDSDTVERIAGEYFYDKDGLAMRVIDALVAKGLCSFSDECNISDKLSFCLQSGDVLCFFCTAKDEITAPKRECCTNRKQFIESFSKIAGNDCDRITELIYDMDNIPGVEIKSSPNTLSVCVIESSATLLPLVHFSFDADLADVWICPEAIKAALDEHGNDIITFFKNNKVVKKEHDHDRYLCFVDIGALIHHERELFTIIKSIADKIRGE